MSHTLFFVAQLYVLTILLASLFSSLYRRPIRLSSRLKANSRAVEGILNYSHAPILLLTVYLIGVAKDPLACFTGIAIQGTIIFIGSMLKRRHIIAECHCFGNLDNGDQTRGKLIFICLIISSACLAILSVLEIFRGDSSESNAFGREGVLALAALFAIVAGFFVKITDRSAAILDAKVTKSPERAAHLSKPTLQADQVVGRLTDGTEVSLQDLGGNRPLLMIGMVTDCEACAVLKPLVGPLSTAFNKHIQVVLTFYDEAEEDARADLEIPIVIRNASHFNEKIGATSYPYALLIDPTDFRILSPLIYGPQKIWLLYFLALGLAATKKQSNQTKI